jgi:valyl-tRNA synthetase
MESARAFANKIWNASRLIFMNMERSKVEPWVTGERDCCLPEKDGMVAPLEDRWIFSRLNRCADQVNRAVEQHRYHEVAQTLWHFVWHEFCDWYLEVKKLRLEENSGANAHWRNLLTVYEMSLRLLHPVMPFLTEELWQRLATGVSDRPESISIANYPQYSESAVDTKAEQEMSILQDIITAARELKSDLKVDKKTILEGTLVLREAAATVGQTQQAVIEKLGGLKLTLRTGPMAEQGGVVRSGVEFDLIVQAPEVAQGGEAQKARLRKENEQLEKVIASSNRQLGDEKFTGRAPAHVIDTLKQKLADYESQFKKNKEALGE